MPTGAWPTEVAGRRCGQFPRRAHALPRRWMRRRIRRPPRRASTPAAAFVVADILADRSAGRYLRPRFLARHPLLERGQDRHQRDMRDNWCVGFSRRYTVAVWVGNASGNPMHDVSGTSGAAPVWREVMDWLHRGDATGARPPPSAAPRSLQRAWFHCPVRLPSREPPRQEWFLTGTEMVVVREAGATRLARIAYPATGAFSPRSGHFLPVGSAFRCNSPVPPGRDGAGRSTRRRQCAPTVPRYGYPAPAPTRSGSSTPRDWSSTKSSFKSAPSAANGAGQRIRSPADFPGSGSKHCRVTAANPRIRRGMQEYSGPASSSAAGAQPQRPLEETVVESWHRLPSREWDAIAR